MAIVAQVSIPASVTNLLIKFFLLELSLSLTRISKYSATAEQLEKLNK